MMFKIFKKRVQCLSQKLNLVAYLVAENIALRQQLLVLKRKHNRPKLNDRDRLLWVVPPEKSYYLIHNNLERRLPANDLT
jgi:hypothetical protein